VNRQLPDYDSLSTWRSEVAWPNLHSCR
jgi:hypothetical protein